MSQERTEAIVLRHVDWSETSRIVTFLAPSRGRVACMVAGARRPKSPFGPLLDTFNRVEICYSWKDGRSVQRLTDVSLLDGFAGLKADLDKTIYAAFPLELALKTAQENEPSEELYRVLCQGLKGLVAWHGDARTHTCWQVAHLLAAGGYEPQVWEATPHSSGRFSYDTGVAEPGERGERPLSAEAHAALFALVRATDACPDVTAPPELFRLLYGYACRQLDTDFRSVQVINQMEA